MTKILYIVLIGNLLPFFLLPISNKKSIPSVHEEEYYDVDLRKVLPLELFGDYSHNNIYSVEYEYEKEYNFFYYEFPGSEQELNLYFNDNYPIWTSSNTTNRATNLVAEDHEGVGLVSMKILTSEFNYALLNGYNSEYKEEYLYIVENNPGGFYGIDINNFQLLYFMEYLQDYAIWRFNEVVYPELTDVTSDDLGLMVCFFDDNWIEIEESDWMFTIEDVSKVENVDNNFKNINFFDFGWWPKSSYGGNWSVTYYNTDFNNDGSYRSLIPYISQDESFSKQHIYDLPKFENSFYPTKQVLYLDFKESEIEDWFLNINNSSFVTLGSFKNQFESDLILQLNQEFIQTYGEKELGHDRNQGFYELEDIRLSNLDISYQQWDETSNQFVVINDNQDSSLLSDFSEIKVSVSIRDGDPIFDSENSNSYEFDFDPSILPSNYIPEETTNSWIIWVSILLIILIILIIILSIIYLKKHKN